MDKIISQDGTAIAYARSGTGPPLVLVHGVAGTQARWARIRPALEQHFTVFTVERRGRGESGDNPNYAIEREFEDVAAIVDAIPEPVNLFGHSYGAHCALEAALLTPNIRTLVLYEPSLQLPSVQLYPPGSIDQLQSLLDTGDREGLLTTFLSTIVKLPPHELDLMRTAPAWSTRLAAAHTLPRELRAHAAYRFNAERFQNLAIPTMLLLGGDSLPVFHASAEVFHAGLPNSQVVILPGQQHIAMDTAPDLLVHVVRRFLSEAR